MKKVIFCLLVLVALASCTVTKRIHNSGFHIQWKSSPKSAAVHDKKESIFSSSEKEIIHDAEEIEGESIVPSIDQTILHKTDDKGENDKLTELKRSSNVMFNHQPINSEGRAQHVRRNNHKNPISKASEKKKRQRDIDWGQFWSWVGVISLIVLFVALELIAKLGAGLIAQVAGIIFAIVVLVMCIIAMYYFFYFIGYLLFGWMW
jgi:hypothetical protein